MQVQVDGGSGMTFNVPKEEVIVEPFLLNLIDTPGHVDFSHEVMRSLGACEAALLLVDAAQGVQAQTVAAHSAARAAGLTIIPVINKIDLPNADVPKVLDQVRELSFQQQLCLPAAWAMVSYSLR
jgi:small GTP-binding protein